MKQTILTIFFAIIALGASAQSPISFQVKAGVGTSNFYGENVESDTRIAYKVGVSMNYEINRTWVVQPSLNFVSIGAREEVEYVGKVNMNELYIQLPIMMAARLNLGKNYSASLSAGPYIAYGVGGKTSGEMEEYDYSSEYNPIAIIRHREILSQESRFVLHRRIPVLIYNCSTCFRFISFSTLHVNGMARMNVRRSATA